MVRHAGTIHVRYIYVRNILLWPVDAVRRVAPVAYNNEIADEIRAIIGKHPGLSEREMFGGIAFMINGNMAVGVSGDELMVRVGKDAHDEMVALPGAATFDKSARPMRGWLNVTSEGFATEDDFKAWIGRGVSFAESLPKK